MCCVSKSLGMKGPLFSKLSTVLISNLKLSQKLGFDALLSPIPQLIKMLRAKGKLERVDIDEGGKCRRSLDPSRYQQGLRPGLWRAAPGGSVQGAPAPHNNVVSHSLPLMPQTVSLHNRALSYHFE